jgi:hypothetical protein
MTKTLVLDATKAKGLYKNATPEFKEMLHDSFGKDFFSEKITDRIKTFSDVCKVLGVDEDDFYDDHTYETADELAYRQLKLIVKALNEEWTPDWDNQNQYKYYPYFDMRGSGLVFYFVDFWCRRSAVGSRLCFRSRELAEYAAKQFTDIYKAYFK